MGFKNLVRFEHEGQAKFGDLVSETNQGYLVKPLDGSLESGFTQSDEPTIAVTKVSQSQPVNVLRQRSQKKRQGK